MSWFLTRRVSATASNLQHAWPHSPRSVSSTFLSLHHRIPQRPASRHLSPPEIESQVSTAQLVTTVGWDGWKIAGEKEENLQTGVKIRGNEPRETEAQPDNEGSMFDVRCGANHRETQLDACALLSAQYL